MKFFKGLFILLLLSCTSAAWAQYTYIEPELCIGTNQGIAVWPTVGFNPSVQQNVDVRYNGGFTFRYIGQKYFGVQVELNYAQRGWSETSPTTGELYSRRFDYLELPFIAHIWFGKRDWRFFINLGPKIRVMVNDDSTAPWSEGAGVQQTKPIENIFDYSIFAGLGVEYRTKKSGIFQLEVRYDYGLGNVFKSNKGEDFAQSNNTAITIGVTYLYDLYSKKKPKNKH